MEKIVFEIQRFTEFSNYTKNTIVSGTSSNDSIWNSAGGVKIYGGAGADYLYNSTLSDYTINSSYGYVTIDGGAGNDYIYSNDPYVSMSGGEGSDSIYVNDWRGITVNGGKGNDSIYSASSRSYGVLYQYANGDGNDTIYGFTDDDTLKITGSSSTVQSGSDLIVNVGSGSIRLKDYSLPVSTGVTLSNSTSSILVNGSSYADSIRNDASKVTVSTGAGSDTIENYASSVSILGGDGNDSINSNYGTYSGAYVTINAGDGSDTIVGRYGDSSISGGAGNDVVSMSGDVDRATINGGKGNDVVYLDGWLGYDGRNMIQYASGDGNDTVYGFKSSDSVSISGSYSTVQSGSDLIYNVGSGSIRLVNYTVPVPSGVSITNSTSYQTLTGSDYNDTIKNIYSSGGDYVLINALSGNDSIYTDWSWHLTINAGDGDDTITSYRGYSNTINAGAGNDIISLGSSSGVQTVRGGAGADTIYGDTVNAYGVVYHYLSGDGNDVIYNFHSNDTITGATYSSVISGKNVILNMSGGGTVTLVGASTVPVETFTEGADSYTNTASNTVLSALGGNDTIKNSAAKVIIYAGDGNDRISNTGVSLTAYGGAGDDSVYNSGDYSYIDLGDGADSIYAYDNDNVTVQGGAGNDFISGSFYESRIYGGAGADKISITGAWNTINGGTGNDTIYGVSNSSLGALYQYAYGDGFDSILNYNSADTISIAGTSQYTTLTSGSHKIVSVIGSGAMTLNGAGSKTLNVTGGTYVPVNLGVNITNSTSNRTLTGTTYGDTIKNIYSGGGDTVSINAGAGNDSIYNDWGYYVTIDAGAGDDTITIYRGSSDSINGGAGADIISLSSSKGLNVIRGGAGNDTIYGDTTAHLYQYENGDGYDSIVGYSANDSITITGGDWSKSTVGSDVIIKITNSNSTVQTGAITLSGAKGKTINVYPAQTIPPETETGTGTSTVPSVTQQEVIQKFMGVLDTVNSDGVSRLNQAVSVASGGYFTGINAAINQMVADCQSANNANDFLLNYCGINLSNTDTGAITGKDAGGSTIKTAQSIVPESGSLNNFTGSSFTTNGLTVRLASYPYWNWSGSMAPTAISYSSLTNNTERYIWQAFQTWWAGASLNLIAQSYGDNFSFGSNSSAPVKEMYFGFVRENSGMMAVTGYSCSNSNGANTSLKMAVNMNNYSSLIIGNSDGKISGNDGFYLDRVLAHEFTHAVMAANINYFGGLPNLIAEGMAELTHGTDDDRYSEILALASSPSSLRNALSINYDTYDSYAGGYMFLRYLAKQSSDHSGAASSASGGSMSAIISSSNNSGGSVTTQRGVSIKSGVLTADKTFDEDTIDLSTYPSTVTKVNATALTSGVMIIGNTKANSISAGKGADTVSGNLGNDIIAGGAGNDVLFGDAGNDKISGDAGNDTISGGYGNDTLTGGAGSDVFVYIAGNDLITDYAAGQDKVQLFEDNILSSSISGSNVVFTTGNGTITIKGGKGKQITVIDKNGEETSSVYGGTSSTSSGDGGISVKSAVLTASTTFSGDTIDLSEYATTVTKVNATALTQNVDITGNDLANSIKAGKGNDTISALAGNDTVYGGAGDDVIYGGDGNDKLYGEAGDDTLFSGTGNDTLTGGAGADVFVYGGGSSFIADYAVGQDKIKLASDSITGASLSSSNIILKTSSGNITVKGGKNKQLTIIDANGKETSQIYPSYIDYDASRTAVTLAAGFTGTLKAADYDSTVKKIDASALAKAFVNGNAQNNTILGGTGADTIYGGAGADSIFGAAGNDKLFGDAGNDTLWGGAGADTLTGGAGSDTFVYSSGEGKDVIADYAAGDSIKISSGAITATGYKSSDVVFTVGSGTLTVKNGKGKAITITDAAGKTTTQTYTNGVSYGSNGVSGSNGFWFTEDDTKFIGSENNLDTITEPKYSVEQICATDFENFAQSNFPTITSGEK